MENICHVTVKEKRSEDGIHLKAFNNAMNEKLLLLLFMTIPVSQYRLSGSLMKGLSLSLPAV